jgi:hypothetical protein
MITKERKISYVGGNAQFSVLPYANFHGLRFSMDPSSVLSGEGLNEVEQRESQLVISLLSLHTYKLLETLFQVLPLSLCEPKRKGKACKALFDGFNPIGAPTL